MPDFDLDSALAEPAEEGSPRCGTCGSPRLTEWRSTEIYHGKFAVEARCNHCNALSALNYLLAYLDSSRGYLITHNLTDYLATGHCPYCQRDRRQGRTLGAFFVSAEITPGEEKMGEGHRQVSCSCGRSWREGYRVKGGLRA